jgi:hypothetical protein
MDFLLWRISSSANKLAQVDKVSSPARVKRARRHASVRSPGLEAKLAAKAFTFGDPLPLPGTFKTFVALPGSGAFEAVVPPATIPAAMLATRTDRNPRKKAILLMLKLRRRKKI